jgi:hypothetical protein
VLFQRLASDDFARMFEQIVEQFEGLKLKGHKLRLPSQFTGQGVELKNSETEYTRRAATM